MKKMDYTELFEMKKAIMDEVEDQLKELGYREKALLTDWVENGEEQRYDKDGNALYLDENGERTIDVTDKPCMRTVYVEKMKKPEELEGHELVQYKAIQQVREALIALV